MANDVKSAARHAPSWFLAFSFVAIVFELGSILALGESTHNITEVDALLPFKQLIKSSSASFSGWTNETLQDPCGAPTCGQLDAFMHKGVQGIPSCAWEGVSCTGGHITALRLDCTEKCVHPIHGQLPESLSTLSSLHTLSLKYNALTGSLPDGAGWSSLQHLDLRGNKLQATLPAEWGTALPKLEYLDLGGNMLHGTLPSAWCDWTNIQSMDLSANSLHGGVPTCYSDAAALNVLVLNDNCLMCGGLPLLQARLYARNTSLGSGCAALSDSSGQCQSSSSNSSLMIGLAAVLGSFMLCLVQRHILWRCRVARILLDIAAEEAAQAAEQAERGEAGRQKLGKHIPSFEACVELAESSVTGKSRQLIGGFEHDSSSHESRAAPSSKQAHGLHEAEAVAQCAGGNTGKSRGIVCPAGRGDSVSEVALWEAITAVEAAGHLSAGATPSTCAAASGVEEAAQLELPGRETATSVAAQAAAALQNSAGPYGGAGVSINVPGPQHLMGGSSSRSNRPGLPSGAGGAAGSAPALDSGQAGVLSPTVVVMPDRQHVAIAMPEILPDGSGMGNSKGNSCTQLCDQQQGLGSDAQPQQQPSHAGGAQLARRAQHASRRMWAAVGAGVAYLFVQPVHAHDLLPQHAGRSQAHVGIEAGAGPTPAASLAS